MIREKEREREREKREKSAQGKCLVYIIKNTSETQRKVDSETGEERKEQIEKEMFRELITTHINVSKMNENVGVAKTKAIMNVCQSQSKCSDS